MHSGVIESYDRWRLPFSPNNLDPEMSLYPLLLAIQQTNKAKEKFCILTSKFNNYIILIQCCANKIRYVGQSGSHTTKAANYPDIDMQLDILQSILNPFSLCQFDFQLVTPWASLHEWSPMMTMRFQYTTDYIQQFCL